MISLRKGLCFLCAIERPPLCTHRQPSVYDQLLDGSPIPLVPPRCFSCQAEHPTPLISHSPSLVRAALPSITCELKDTYTDPMNADPFYPPFYKSLNHSAAGRSGSFLLATTSTTLLLAPGCRSASTRTAATCASSY